MNELNETKFEIHNNYNNKTNEMRFAANIISAINVKGIICYVRFVSRQQPLGLVVYEYDSQQAIVANVATVVVCIVALFI